MSMYWVSFRLTMVSLEIHRLCAHTLVCVWGGGGGGVDI